MKIVNWLFGKKKNESEEAKDLLRKIIAPYEVSNASDDDEAQLRTVVQ